MRNRLAQLAKTPRLLVASDFDGTLAPIMPHPSLASAPESVLDRLRHAALLPQTCVAIVSGRALVDLRDRIGQLRGAWLVGGHGAEISGPNLEHLPQDGSIELEAAMGPLRQLAPPDTGFLLEQKSTGIAVHYRNVAPPLATAVIDRIEREIASHFGLTILRGKMVLELLHTHTDKGAAIRKLKNATGATGVLFVGDDTTDEHAFEELSDTDAAIKVGTPPTAADFCVASVQDAHVLIDELIALREQWLASTLRSPIHRHSVLSDLRTMAIISPDARVEWLCLPRIDSGSVFASLLGGDAFGTWSIAPVDGGSPTSQRYRGSSFSLETSWPSMRVTDYLDGSSGRTFQRAGRTDLVRVIEGRGTARIVFAPRLDFARARTRLTLAGGGIIVEGAADPMVLWSSNVQWLLNDDGGHQTAIGLAHLDNGPALLELRAGTRALTPSPVPESVRRDQTERVWTQWAASLKLPPLATDLCRRSALVLRSLTYGPTGALLAAGTTSLPETPGGVRNWDYRFCWPRDAAVAAAALVRLGNTGIAMKYLDWLLSIIDRCVSPEKLRPIYTVSGEELGPEADLSHLPGYRFSQPVRIGNAAGRQVQLDVFGPIVDLIHMLAQAGAAVSPDHWRLVEAMATAVERMWDQPDHGIWEVRTDKQHHVHSKTMCWLALDRAVKLAEQFVGVSRESWASLRDLIRSDVISRGFDTRLNAFVAAYDRREPDASALAVGLSGMLKPDDPRFLGTINLVQAKLLEGGTVYRYRYDDAIPGPEGGFTICTGWLIESLVLSGQLARARELFDALCAAAGPTGLLAEQWCPNEQIGLGNFPQAFSHAAVINAAAALAAHAPSP